MATCMGLDEVGSAGSRLRWGEFWLDDGGQKSTGRGRPADGRGTELAIQVDDLGCDATRRRLPALSP